MRERERERRGKKATKEPGWDPPEDAFSKVVL